MEIYNKVTHDIKCIIDSTIRNMYMKEIILLMIRAGYVFNMDRDRLRDAMEELTYMLCPEDDINKDRVIKGLEYDDTDSDDDYVDDEEDGGGDNQEIEEIDDDGIEDITPKVVD